MTLNEFFKKNNIQPIKLSNDIFLETVNLINKQSSEQYKSALGFIYVSEEETFIEKSKLIDANVREQNRTLLIENLVFFFEKNLNTYYSLQALQHAVKNDKSLKKLKVNIPITYKILKPVRRRLKKKNIELLGNKQEPDIIAKRSKQNITVSTSKSLKKNACKKNCYTTINER